jgi:hypothetical protein
MMVSVVIEHRKRTSIDTYEMVAVSDPIVLPLTVALSYGPEMLKVALKAGHVVTLSPVIE